MSYPTATRNSLITEQVKTRSFSDVGREHNISSERVRQIVNQERRQPPAARAWGADLETRIVSCVQFALHLSDLEHPASREDVLRLIIERGAYFWTTVPGLGRCGVADLIAWCRRHGFELR